MSVYSSTKLSIFQIFLSLSCLSVLHAMEQKSITFMCKEKESDRIQEIENIAPAVYNLCGTIADLVGDFPEDKNVTSPLPYTEMDAVTTLLTDAVHRHHSFGTDLEKDLTRTLSARLALDSAAMLNTLSLANSADCLNCTVLHNAAISSITSHMLDDKCLDAIMCNPAIFSMIEAIATPQTEDRIRDSLVENDPSCSFFSLHDIHGEEITGIAFHSHDPSMLAYGLADGTIRIRNIYTKRETDVPGHDCTVSGLAFNSKGTQLASCAYDGKIIIRDQASTTPLHTVTLQQGIPLGVIFNCDSTKLACINNDDFTIKIWDAPTFDDHHPVLHNQTSISSIAFNPRVSRQLASGSQENEGLRAIIELWDITTGRNVRTLSTQKRDDLQHVHALAFNADGTLLAAGCSSSTNIWRPLTGELVLDQHTDDSCQEIVFNPQGTVLFAGYTGFSGPIQIWNVLRGYSMQSLKTVSVVTALSCNANGSFFASTSRGDIYVWKREPKRFMKDLTLPELLLYRWAQKPGFHEKTINQYAYLRNMYEKIKDQTDLNENLETSLS